jgi:hypothetical protein
MIWYVQCLTRKDVVELKCRLTVPARMKSK